MRKQPTTVDHTVDGTPATASGAHLESIPPEVAAGFLARLGERSPEPIDAAVGAREDNGNLIGVAVLGASNPERASATVAVTPERRRLKVGSDLLYALLGHAQAHGLRYLILAHPAAGPAEGLVRSLGLSIARRVDHGVTKLVVLVPSQG
jgi:GNAT superfamily N-acetyltransferase